LDFEHSDASPPRRSSPQQHNGKSLLFAQLPATLYLVILSRVADMSAIVLSSEAADVTSSAPRRKSGRVSKKPNAFNPATSPVGSAKRKRTDESDEDVDIEEAADEEEEQESSEGEPDEEELREQRRKKKSKPATRKPAPKKPKTNGASISLALRPATSKPKRPRKAPVRKSAIIGEEADGLYGEHYWAG
jgi:cohesin complex subunit SA-1/2